jgi:hypothetical protein
MERNIPRTITGIDLGVWHPLALPANKQNRAGYEMLDQAEHPSNIDRSRRHEAIHAVQAFRDELDELIVCDVLYRSRPLHHQIHLDLPPAAAISTVLAIAQAALRHGLVCYDPQTDTLTLPPSLSLAETHNPAGASQPPAIPAEPAINATFGPWTLRAYVEATRRCYSQIEKSGCDACGCANCKNFALVRDRAYPSEVLAIFNSLGIDIKKESEVHYYGRTPAGLHTYRGWFYLVGIVEHGPESWQKLPNNRWERRFHPFRPSFEAGLGKKAEFGFSGWETVLLSAGFADGPCVEIDFYANLPWLSDAPEPDAAAARDQMRPISPVD